MLVGFLTNKPTHHIMHMVGQSFHFTTERTHLQ
ncbi:MAG: hypothetical protein QOD32_924 [Pyrinomonadaceae bacterium]|jgi:hypothetical protein|nr:hypothetical protein [Pyrinomonadaceae bacterium]